MIFLDVSYEMFLGLISIVISEVTGGQTWPPYFEQPEPPALACVCHTLSQVR